MADVILVHGDKAHFLPNFGPAVVVVKPGTLLASGSATLNKKRFVSIGMKRRSPYRAASMTPQYSIPGTGTLKIAALAPDQKAKKTNF